MRRPASGRDERGLAVVVSTALLGVLVTVTLAAVGVTSVVLGHRAAQSAADLASLAAAGAVQDGGDACGAARRVAVRNHARVVRCQVEGFVVTVETEARTGRLPGGALELRARARAGPVGQLP
ncbi:Rv3654c family TadE-like protein [Nocardioides aurantiacus]|uniref:Secretion/DNA translocation related TadE-like protein n=1 Tax=Nocardioides aurantiacus TaxID=86796 RepID=A0A3N2CPU2_9ACTN|nr:Rv3654c family TadE-like protein [Nocardioides aurantiacus]ROR89344.1 secretion/DNA translocation related TadE-like protein [Nocardioides aurantiacus]